MDACKSMIISFRTWVGVSRFSCLKQEMIVFLISLIKKYRFSNKTPQTISRFILFIIKKIKIHKTQYLGLNNNNDKKINK
jgi:hypothetical protein